MKIYDTLIIGAGVIGSFLASDLARSGYSVCLVDKAADVSTGASKANSGLIHAGFDAKPNTLKAKLNVEGNRMYPLIAKRLSLPIKKVGTLVVGSDKKVVENLYARGMANGVKNLSILQRDQIKEIVPNINDSVSVALHAKDSYIISPYLLTISLADEAIINGADIILNFDIKSVKRESGIFTIKSAEKTICTKTIINSAGAGVNEVAKLIGSETYPIVFRRGEYFVLDSTESGIAPLTIFPLPSEHSKGVLVTPTIDGNILVGPTSYESDSSTITTSVGLGYVRENSASLLCNINLKKSIRQFSGVRCVVGDDFVIEKSKKVDGVLTLAGICSPGLSAAPAISKYAINLLGLNYAPSENAKKIQPYTLFKNCSKPEKNELLSKNKAYGKIICKCENITEGDILMALDRPLKIQSIDGVKRRVRAGMGRCQGGFCMLAVANIIAKKRKIPLEEVLKENKNSNFIMFDIRGGAR